MYILEMPTYNSLDALIFPSLDDQGAKTVQDILYTDYAFCIKPISLHYELKLLQGSQT